MLPDAARCCPVRRGDGLAVRNVTPCEALSVSRVPPMEEHMRNLVLTVTAGLLLISAAGVDAAAKPKLIEGRAAYQASHNHWRGNDFGSGFERLQPAPNKGMPMKSLPEHSA